MQHKQKTLKKIILIITIMTLMSAFSISAYCVELVKGEWYEIPAGKYIYYGSANGGIFFLDQEAYNVAVKNSVPIIPMNGTQVSIVNNFTVNGKSYDFKSINTSELGSVTKVPNTAIVDYLVFYGGYHLYQENVDLAYLYSDGDTHYFVNSEVLNYIQYSGNEKFRIYDKELIERIPRDNIQIVGCTFDEAHMDDYVIDSVKFNMGQGKDPDKPLGELDEERIKAIEDKLEELGLDLESIREDIDLNELQHKDITDKLDIIISQDNEQYKTLKDIFYQDDDNRLEKIDTNISTLVDLNKVLVSCLFAGQKDENGNVITDDTLFSRLDRLEKNITDSLTATNERTLEELNETLLTTNRFLSYLFTMCIILICLVIASLVWKLLHSVVSRNVY